MTTTLIVPGLDSSPAPHWQHWWARTDPDAVMVEFADPHRPTPELWGATLAGMILRHPDSILVGHSLGAILIARMLARWPGLRISAAMLVAPADPANSDRLTRFQPIPQQRFDIPAVVVASHDDPWMSFGQAAQLAASWDAELLDLGHAGHVNVAAGFGPWPGGKIIRDRLAARVLPQPALQPRFPRAVPHHVLARV